MTPLNLAISTDGKGLWSEKIIAVKVIGFELEDYDEPDFKFGAELRVYFDPTSWDVNANGMIYTDPAFLKGVRENFSVFGLPTEEIGYSEAGMQGDDYVSFDVGSEFAKALAEKIPSIRGINASSSQSESSSSKLELTHREIAYIREAKRINRQIQKLYDRIDQRIDPIVKRFLEANADIEKLKMLVDRLPEGFHRSELRVMIYKRENGEA
jgi:hypothetical protein